MTLVPVYVLFDDGLWHRNPLLASDNWLVTFDDEDDPELVIKRDQDEKADKTEDRLVAIANSINATIITQGYRSIRNFWPYWKTHDSFAAKINFHSPPPLSLMVSGGSGVQEPTGPCVMWDFRNSTSE